MTERALPARQTLLPGLAGLAGFGEGGGILAAALCLARIHAVARLIPLDQAEWLSHDNTGDALERNREAKEAEENRTEPVHTRILAEFAAACHLLFGWLASRSGLPVLLVAVPFFAVPNVCRMSYSVVGWLFSNHLRH